MRYYDRRARRLASARAIPSPTGPRPRTSAQRQQRCPGGPMRSASRAGSIMPTAPGRGLVLSRAVTEGPATRHLGDAHAAPKASATGTSSPTVRRLHCCQGELIVVCPPPTLRPMLDRTAFGPLSLGEADALPTRSGAGHCSRCRSDVDAPNRRRRRHERMFASQVGVVPTWAASVQPRAPVSHLRKSSAPALAEHVGGRPVIHSERPGRRA